VRCMVLPATPGQPGCSSQTATAATSESAVRPGHQTAQGRAHGGGEYTGGLRNPRSGGSKFGPLAGQLDRQHQFCRARQLDAASESSALNTAHARVLQGPDMVRETTVVVVSVLPFRVTAQRTFRTPLEPLDSILIIF